MTYRRRWIDCLTWSLLGNSNRKMINNNKAEFKSLSCNEGKHFFINSEFCDRCNIDFDSWYIKTIEQVHKETKYETSEFLLRSLRAIINSQVQAKLLKRKQGDTIYEFVEGMAIQKGYAAW
jgi:hypothetical protein